MQSMNGVTKWWTKGFQSNNYYCLLIHRWIKAKPYTTSCLPISSLSQPQLKSPVSCRSHHRKVLTTNCLTAIRCLSLKSDSKVKTKITNTTTTTTTTQPSGDNQKADVLPKKGSVNDSIGIVGINQWDIKKRVFVDEWLCVYHFPYIVHLMSVQKMKIMITILSIVMIPSSYLLYAMDSLSIETCYMSSVVAIFSTFMLYIFGQVFRRLVGRVYISEDKSMVRLSHLSFFGNRIDTDIELSDVMPLTDNNNRLNDWFCRIERYSCDDLLYMSLKYGGIQNTDGFGKVFGKHTIKALKMTEK